MKTICQYCGKEFSVRPSLLKKGYGKFCNSTCYGKWQSINRVGENNPMFNSIQIKCAYCNKSISKRPSEIKKYNFCSNKCKYNWQKTSGCISGPNSPSWKGGHTHYRGNNWSQQRQLRLMLDNYKCQHCSSANKLSVHHVKPFHLFDDYKIANNTDNLITLCKKCHGIAEVKFNRDHPELIDKRRIPFFKPEPKICSKCGQVFVPSSHRVKWCNDCKTYTWEYCGETFTSSRYRKVRFCSRQCFVKHADKNAKWKRKCKHCGKKIASGRSYCKFCFLHYIKPASKSFLKT